ncbi:MAG: ribonuclease J [Deltaproteobacteria bacterium]|nr:ribonuclease J [Deltaproteobacteria bacterium]MBW2110510.1 ribonuclease J [Deltaproteobacteria bacterium]MBW2351602.1 ribonuclease J [Deltaproteobacteria bacterium]HDZ89435.1 ribonuclease J [Deltaproteobacteria bacterium]
MLKVIPIGGLGEIGLNMMVVEYGTDLMIVDAGLMFPNDYMPGIDLVIPDFTYLRENREKIRAVILTHGHEDHIGAIPFFLREFPVPVMGTGFTLGLLRAKLREYLLPVEPDLREIRAGENISLGPFNVEFISVNHSIVDGVGLAIDTPEGILLHSGDFRIDPTPVDSQFTDLIRFAHFGEKGVLAFFSDSTNAEKDGYTLSEKDVRKTLDDLFQTCRGRLVVASFASNITRIQQVISLAVKFGRKVIFNGKSMITNVGIAREQGFIHIPEGSEIGERQIDQFPDHKILIITTGSQGEPMSALTRMAQGKHRGIKIKRGDTIILSSRFIPGNERAITSVINRLYRLGAEVVYEKVSDIHTSGHARREELKLMLSLVKPRFFVPVHGEYRHLVKHAQIASEMGMADDRIIIAEDGDVISFENRQVALKTPVTTGRVLVDGKGVGDIGETVLRDRRKLGGHGMVVVLLIVDEETGETIYGPEIISRGFIFDDQGQFILEDAECIVLEVLDELDRPSPIDQGRIESEIRRRLKRFFYRVIERSPLIMPVIIAV